MQYAQWSALFFAIKSGDQKTVDLLVENNAEMCTRDQASVILEYKLTV